MRRLIAAWALAASGLGGAQAGTVNDAAAVFQQHCAVCHGADRLGGMGPALLPESLERLKPDALRDVLRNGRAATQMPGFASQLSAAALEQMAGWLRTAPAEVPHWEAADIRASRVIYHPQGSLPDKPVFQADPSNLFLVVEAGTHHLSVLDGDRLEPIHRFPTASRCTAARSSAAMAAMCMWRAATAGSASTTCGT